MSPGLCGAVDSQTTAILGETVPRSEGFGGREIGTASTGSRCRVFCHNSFGVYTLHIAGFVFQPDGMRGNGELAGQPDTKQLNIKPKEEGSRGSKVACNFS